MEVIKKIISLEQYKSRFNHKTPYIEKDGTITSVTINNWGKIPCDYYFSSLEECPFAKIKDKIPLVSGINIISSDENVIFNENCFRYKTMVFWHNWINKYGINSRYYKLCKRESEYIWSELNHENEYGDFFEIDYNLGLTTISSLTYTPTDYTSYTIGDIIEVNSDAEILNDVFRVTDDNTRYELIILDFINNIFDCETVNDSLSLPYIDIPIHISQTIDNLGLLTTTAKEWEPRKEYKINDIVLYKGKTYILKDGDSCGLIEIKGGLYNTFVNYIETNDSELYNFKNINEINNIITIDKVYDSINKKKNIYYNIENDYYRIYLPYISHNAQMGDDGEFIFNTDYWELNNTIEEISEEDNEYISLTSDSKLTSLRRYKKNVDDDGNILPFILDSKSSMDAELPYHTGIFNVYMGANESVRGDIMVDIGIYGDNDYEGLAITYDDSGATHIFKYFCIDIEENIENVISLKDIMLTNISSANTVVYKWKEISRGEEMDKSIEITDSLPIADEESYENFCQLITYENNSISYVIYQCVEECKKVFYEGTVTNRNIYITPSMLLSSNSKFRETNGIINFSYIKDGVLIDEGKGVFKKYENDAGLLYLDKYKYEINVGAVNLTSSKVIEEKAEHVYKLYPYILEEGDKVSGKAEDCDTYDYYNVGKIFSIENDEGAIVGYKRMLSEYNFIDIDFDSEIYEITSTDVDKLKKNVILSNILYTIKNAKKNDFNKDYIFKEEYTIGFEDVTEDFNINIERGISSAYEKHHILCEIKSLGDLENYRNNLFKI